MDTKLTRHIEDFSPPLTLDYLRELDKLMDAHGEAQRERGGFSGKGKLNCYQCEDGWAFVITRDRDEGTTPFLIGCSPETVGVGLSCGGMMRSMMYRLAERPRPGLGLDNDEWPVSHEWIRPQTQAELDAALARDDEYHSYTDHLSRGGLHLSRIDGIETASEMRVRNRKAQIEDLSKPQETAEHKGVIIQGIPAHRHGKTDAGIKTVIKRVLGEDGSGSAEFVEGVIEEMKKQVEHDTRWMNRPRNITPATIRMDRLEARAGQMEHIRPRSYSEITPGPQIRYE